MDGAKLSALRATYARMSTAEIERRLLHGDLVEAAHAAANEELARRKAAPAAAGDAASAAGGSPRGPAGEAEERSSGAIVAFLVGMALLSLAAWLLLSAPSFFFVIAFVVLPAAAAMLGKALPRLAQALGWALVATPLWLGGYMWQRGELAWQHGDYGPLGSLVVYGMLFAVSCFGIAIGAGLIAGARHQGSWRMLLESLKARHVPALDKARRLD